MPRWHDSNKRVSEKPGAVQLARQGHGIKFIARELGISRNTVRKYLRKARSLPSDKVRPARP
ncbi:helix-turn-helix domain-containing protein, partial [Pseudomonas savastanoi]